MLKKWFFLAASIPIVGVAVCALALPSYAFDHRDSPATAADNEIDIADVFSFMRPEPGGGPSSHLVLIMTFAPDAPTGKKLSADIDYVFYLRALSPPPSLTPVSAIPIRVTCNFPVTSPQRVVCNANGTLGASTVDDTDAGAPNAPVRVFAGLRSDPAFADVTAFRETIATRQNKFKNPGTNAFQGKNAMSIVVEIDVKKIVHNNRDGGSSDAPIIEVSGEIVRGESSTQKP